MAIDTNEKLMSMLNFGDGSYSHMSHEADAAVNADDRQHLLDCYSGIAFAAGAVWTDIGVSTLFTASEWSATVFYFEAYMRAVAGTARARLYDVTAAAAVAGSEVTTVATSMARVRSGNLSLTDGNEHRAQFGSLAADSGKALGARYFD